MPIEKLTVLNERCEAQEDQETKNLIQQGEQYLKNVQDISDTRDRILGIRMSNYVTTPNQERIKIY